MRDAAIPGGGDKRLAVRGKPLVVSRAMPVVATRRELSDDVAVRKAIEAHFAPILASPDEQRLRGSSTPVHTPSGALDRMGILSSSPVPTAQTSDDMTLAAATASAGGGEDSHRSVSSEGSHGSGIYARPCTWALPSQLSQDESALTGATVGTPRTIRRSSSELSSAKQDSQMYRM